MSFERFSPEDLLWPLNEVEKKHAPKDLFVAGDRDLLRAASSVAVVGSRDASREGLARAARLTRMLVERQVVVVSGLAEGIDTAAHEAAIEHGGKTIAVLGTPLDECFPAKNRELQNRIMREHLAVSQFASGTAGGKHTFPMRNRTMVLLSDAMVIIEATDQSGTINQGWEAIRLGRPLFLAASLFENKALTFPSKLADYGAKVLANETLDQLFEVLPQGRRDAEAEIPF